VAPQHISAASSVTAMPLLLMRRLPATHRAVAARRHKARKLVVVARRVAPDAAPRKAVTAAAVAALAVREAPAVVAAAHACR
jgi:hypothetical protein